MAGVLAAHRLELCGDWVVMNCAYVELPFGAEHSGADNSAMTTPKPRNTNERLSSQNCSVSTVNFGSNTVSGKKRKLLDTTESANQAIANQYSGHARFEKADRLEVMLTKLQDAETELEEINAELETCCKMSLALAALLRKCRWIKAHIQLCSMTT